VCAAGAVARAALGMILLATAPGCFRHFVFEEVSSPYYQARVAWSHEMPATVAIAPLPLSEQRVAAVAGNTVHVMALDGSVLHEESFDHEWRAAASEGGDLLLGSRDRLVLWSADGHRALWEFSLPEAVPVGHSPVLASWVAVTEDAVHVLGARSGQATSFPLESLKRAGRYRRRGARSKVVPDDPRLTGAALLHDTVLYAGAADGLYAVDLAGGRLLWHHRIRHGVSVRPALAKRALYVGADDKLVRVLQARSGRRKWRLITGGRIGAPPVLHENDLIVASYDLNLYGLRAHGGHRLWNLNLPRRTDTLALWPPYGLATHPLFSPSLRLYEPHEGQEVMHFTIPEEDDYFTSPMLVRDEILLVGTYRGRLLALTLVEKVGEPEEDAPEEDAAEEDEPEEP
jgi:outer membrane protein assembly factor BamB